MKDGSSAGQYTLHLSGAPVNGARRGQHDEQTGERRRSPRFPATGPCRLVVFDGVEYQRAAATVRDISATGIGITSAMFVFPGMKAHVILRSAAIIGEVRHCRRNEQGTYEIGIKIEAASDVFPGQADANDNSPDKPVH